MRNPLGIAIAIAGVILLVIGINNMHSASSDISKAVTGSPTDHSIWLVTGGVVLTGLGLVWSLRKPRDV